MKQFSIFLVINSIYSTASFISVFFIPAPLKFLAAANDFCSLSNLGTKFLRETLLSSYLLVYAEILAFLNYNYFIFYFVDLCYS